MTTCVYSQCVGTKVFPVFVKHERNTGTSLNHLRLNEITPSNKCSTRNAKEQTPINIPLSCFAYSICWLFYISHCLHCNAMIGKSLLFCTNALAIFSNFCGIKLIPTWSHDRPVSCAYPWSPALGRYLVWAMNTLYLLCTACTYGTHDCWVRNMGRVIF